MAITSINDLIDWHTQQRRIMMAGAMSMGEALVKAQLHEQAIKVLQAVRLDVDTLRAAAVDRSSDTLDT